MPAPIPHTHTHTYTHTNKHAHHHHTHNFNVSSLISDTVTLRKGVCFGNNVYTRLISICKFVTMPKCFHGRSISQLKWFQYKIFLESKYAEPIHFDFIFRIEPNMKSFSHTNNIVLRRVIYIHSLPGMKVVKLFSLANET